MVFKSCVPFTDCISEINNNAKGIDAVMLMYNLIEHSDNYSKTSGNLWQFYRHEPFVNNHGVILDVPVDSDNASFSYEQKIIGQTGNYGTKVVQIMVLLKYLSNFWRTFEMPLITCKIIFLVCSEESIIATGTGDNQEPKLAIMIQNFLFQLWLYQLKIMKNYFSNLKQVLKEQLCGININQNQHYRHETGI